MQKANCRMPNSERTEYLLLKNDAPGIPAMSEDDLFVCFAEGLAQLHRRSEKFAPHSPLWA